MADIAVAVSALLAAGSFAWGISAWKREFVGKRRIELAESVLALFYEAEDAIRAIRNPFSHVGEGSTRKRGEYESDEEARLLDQAHVAFERYEKHEQLFSQLRAARYRFMAAFGPEAGESFLEINKALQRIFFAARMLGTYHWQERRRRSMFGSQGEPDDRHADDLRNQEAIFWEMGSDKDEVGPRVREAVKKVERIARDAAEAAEMSRARALWSWVNGQRRQLPSGSSEDT